MSNPQQLPTTRPLIFGEVLFDTFPDGHRVLGGAPFNVAWHLHGFGLAPVFISRIGDDAAGKEVREAMTGWGMDVAGLQVDPERPTGQVQVRFEAGEPAYEIVEDVAWDHIDRDAALAAAGPDAPGLLYHGTLAARSGSSRAALEALCETGAERFIDVNLRPPWWVRDRVEALCRGAKWVKLNHDELKTLIGGSDMEEAAGRFARALHIGHLVVTLGGDGALLREPEGAVTRARAGRVDQLADTVGAGDAFSAVTILGALTGWAPELSLERAAAFAARICQQPGATANDPALYRDYRAAWGLAR